MVDTSHLKCDFYQKYRFKSGRRYNFTIDLEIKTQSKTNSYTKKIVFLAPSGTSVSKKLFKLTLKIYKYLDKYTNENAAEIEDVIIDDDIIIE